MLKNIKRKIKRKLRNMSTNKLVMFVSVFLVCFITVGYASLNQILKLVGYASIDKGDGVIFTNIVTKENNGATIVNEGNIKAKTLVNTQVSFDKPGSITYTITAKNEAEYDAQLIEIKDLELTNNKEPKCITVSINGHEINDKIYTGATKEFDITITSTCNTLETKEISLKFNYVKTDTINGAMPNIGNKTEELLQNSEKTYNYLDGTYLGGEQSSNYVWFNGFMWRIMGKNADGSIRMITEEDVTAIPWGAEHTAQNYDNSYVNDWLNNYFYPKLKSKEWLVKQTWCSETTTDSSSARTTCSNNLSKIQHYVGLLSLDEYNLASAGSSYLHISQIFWTLTPSSSDNIWYVEELKESASNCTISMGYGLRPIINISSEITITGGNGTLTEPYIFEEKSTSITGTLKDNSGIGEYVTYGGRNYRVLETSENGTKLILDGYYNNGDNENVYEEAYGTNCTLCTTINEDNFINWLSNNDENEKNKLVSTTWYRGDNFDYGDNYKTYLDSTSNSYEGSVGLIRVGEMLSGQSETILSKNHTQKNNYKNTQHYWTATLYVDGYAWYNNMAGRIYYNDITRKNSIRPVINISPKIEIVGGNGTPNSPYELGDAPETAAQYLINNKLQSSVSDGGNGLAAINALGNVTSLPSPREYRYIGSNPDNYVQFNNELWRIIGIFDGQLKIIRNELLDRSWDDNNLNDWSTASLQTYFNGQYYNSIDSNDQSKIDNYTWKLGGTTSGSSVTAQMFYEQERGTTVYTGRPIEWTGKVALMYASDYGFSTSGGSTTNRSTCLSTGLYDWISLSDCINNSWLYYNGTIQQWTLSPEYDEQWGENSVYVVFNEGYVNYADAEGYDGGFHYSYRARPTLYLKSYISITSGSGTESDPYILE